MCPSFCLMSTTLKSWLLCLCGSKTMTIKKAFPCVLNVVILTLVILMPFAQPSTSSRVYGTNMAGSGPIATSIEVARFGNEAASVPTVEDSARQVPTGPDPLHHNNNPIRP